MQVVYIIKMTNLELKFILKFFFPNCRLMEQHEVYLTIWLKNTENRVLIV